MPPHRNVLDVQEMADEHLPRYPIVTESGRWIRVSLPDGWDASDLVQKLGERGYRAKQLGPTLKVTKDGLDWPD